jgi:hypothetical protein
MQDAADTSRVGLTPGEEDAPATSSTSPTHDAVGNGWLLVVVGSAAAIIAAALWCTPPLVPLRSWGSLLGRCLAFLLATATAGAAGIWGAWLLLGSRPSLRRRDFFLHALMGWIFLPCVALLDRTGAASALLVTAMAATAMAVSLRILAPSGDAETTDVLGGIVPEFRSFYGTPIAGFRPGRALLIAICAQGALVLTVTRDFFVAGILLGVGVFLLLWYWSGEVGIEAVARNRGAFARGTVACAFGVTLLVLLPWLVRRGGTIPLAPRRTATAHAAERRAVRPHFSSVILWPPPQRVMAIYFPAPGQIRQDAAQITRPLEIPFDGPYWYFEPPDDGPGQTAHIARGLPTEPSVNMSSADGGPLRMEAVQHLANPIALCCCAELDVSVTNADAHSGPIHLGVLLTDNSSHDKTSELLGFQSVASSETPFFAQSRPQLQDTVHFSIPNSRSLRRFDQITVLVLPSLDNSRGAKIAIQGFTLLPK